nr:hypothetical protein [Streptomyces clavuligerus]
MPRCDSVGADLMVVDLPAEMVQEPAGFFLAEVVEEGQQTLRYQQRRQGRV